MSGPYHSSALQYSKMGFAPLPLLPKQKRPIITNWQVYCTDSPSEKDVKAWMIKYGQGNIGLALGTQVHPANHGAPKQIIALDVDDDDLVEPVLAALPFPGPAKKGKKGLTIFALASPDVKNQKFKRVVDGKPSPKPGVEVLAHGSQTVIPPSIHPEGMEYVWTNETFRSLTEWPYVNDAVLDEIAAICGGKGDHFGALNEMVWLGVGGGGNTHDTCVAAVANLVARGWADSDIRDRILRAKKAACTRAGQPYNWPGADHTIQEWVVSARDKGMSGVAKTRKVPPERLMAEWALAVLGGREQVACINGQLRRYQDGHWPSVDVAGVLRSMYSFDDVLREREAKSAISILHTQTELDGLVWGRTPGLEPRDDPKLHRICLQNGTLNVRTGDLELWDPEHELLHQIQLKWDDEAECPTYDRVVLQTFNGLQSAVEVWDEFCALTLVNDMSFQKVLFLRGPGGNGKGTLARVLRNLHSPQAVGSVAITDLNDERKRTSLVGKLVNISGEQSRLNTVADTYLKKITGGDPVDIRRLYGETQNNVLLSVRFLELVNEMPATMASGDALRRRLILLDCPIRVENPDADLDRKLYAERPGILRRWTAALQRLYTRGHFEVPGSSTIEVEQYMIENDPVAYWVLDQLDPVDEEKGEKGTHGRELWAEFKVWYDMMGYKYAIPEVVWGRRLTSLGYPVIVTRINSKTSMRMRRLRIKPGHESRM